MLGLCSEHVLSMSLAQSFRHTTTAELHKRPLLGLALPIWSFHFAVVNWIRHNRLDTEFTHAHARVWDWIRHHWIADLALFRDYLSRFRVSFDH
jgi:hypothetical protein